MYGFKFEYRSEVVKHTPHNLWVGRVIGFVLDEGRRLYVCKEHDQMWIAREDDLVAWGDFSGSTLPPGYK